MTDISVVFTGQGSQKIGMGQDFVENSPEARKLFEVASQAIGINLIEVCSIEDGRLDQTDFAQPALLATEMVIYNAASKYFAGAPKYFAGHSLGEYTALVAAKVMPFDVAVKIVRRRGELMQAAMKAGGGAMSALVLDNIESTNFKDVVAKAGAEVANYNSSNQVVISGNKANIEVANLALAAAFSEMRIVPLNVSAAFHSSLMKGIEADFKAYMQSFADQFDLSNADKVLSNFTGKFHQPESLIDNLVNQISGAVLWTTNMQVLKELALEVIEIGPSRVLSKFCSLAGINAKTISDSRSLQKAFAQAA